MRERFLADLENILGRIVIGPGGELNPNLFLGIPKVNGQDLSVPLQHWLYQFCFCNTLARAGGPIVAPPNRVTGSLLAELSEANAGQDCWDVGWEIIGVDGAGQVTAKRREIVRSFWPGEFISVEGPGLPPRVGMHLKAFFPKESSTMQPGFYFVFGNSLEEDFDPPAIVRFYWAIESGGAAPLVNSITVNLNRFQVPFRFKTAIDKAAYGRLDAAVLYVHKRFYQITAQLLASVYGAVRSHLARGTPLFTKPLAPGLGLAEDPGTGESFGMQRCRALAGAILAASAGGTGGLLNSVVQQLEALGVRASYPYLSPGSVDQYYFTVDDRPA